MSRACSRQPMNTRIGGRPGGRISSAAGPLARLGLRERRRTILGRRLTESSGETFYKEGREEGAEPSVQPAQDGGWIATPAHVVIGHARLLRKRTS